uniref:RNA-directed RNA polymerase n=1 Tax=Leviviridae sp. TaxID=2027243 RepID=A0A514DC18_9VIRU|nr:MAG: RNA-dependent RNA polymerase [Leviviridae sp.]
MYSKKQGGKFLKGLASYRVAKGMLPLVCEEFLSSLDCPRALTVWLLFSNDEHDQLATLEFSPDHYANFGDLRDAYTATKFLSKYKGLTLDRDLDEVALKKFDEFELLCKQTNNRFKSLERDPLFAGSVVWLHNAVIRKIDRILGDFSTEEFFSLPDWGPGASTLIKRREASPARKFQCETGITRDLFDLIGPDILSQAYPLWGRHLLEQGFPTFQSGNKVITVAKDASTNRVIAVEPGINIFVHQSVGRMLGRRLRRCGVDLRYQERNQRLAQFGSYTNSVATVDFSSASDSISSSVVEALLPPRWFSVMDSCRSRFGNQSGRVIKWEKFSSMGNGFTFQLESLIFYAAAFCCTEFLNQDTSLVSAYGDDFCYRRFALISSKSW